MQEARSPITGAVIVDRDDNNSDVDDDADEREWRIFDGDFFFGDEKADDTAEEGDINQRRDRVSWEQKLY